METQDFQKLNEQHAIQLAQQLEQVIQTTIDKDSPTDDITLFQTLMALE